MTNVEKCRIAKCELLKDDTYCSLGGFLQDPSKIKVCRDWDILEKIKKCENVNCYHLKENKCNDKSLEEISHCGKWDALNENKPEISNYYYPPDVEDIKYFTDKLYEIFQPKEGIKPLKINEYDWSYISRLTENLVSIINQFQHYIDMEIITND